MHVRAINSINFRNECLKCFYCVKSSPSESMSRLPSRDFNHVFNQTFFLKSSHPSNSSISPRLNIKTYLNKFRCKPLSTNQFGSLHYSRSFYSALIYFPIFLFSFPIVSLAKARTINLHSLASQKSRFAPFFFYLFIFFLFANNLISRNCRQSYSQHFLEIKKRGRGRETSFHPCFDNARAKFRLANV